MVKRLYTVVALLVVLFVVGCAGCVNNGEPTATPTMTTTPVPTTPVVTQTPVSTPVQQVSCLMCHEGSEDLDAHLHGGDKCLKCHKTPGGDEADVHTVHPEAAVPCKLCHGMPPTVPQPVGDYTVCENCHAYPDATASVEGNLVEVHIPRGKDCTVCHTGDVSAIHSGKSKAIP
ncbi:MAG: hypothetical protein ACXQTK_05890 [Candidatus Syntropharchaeales archaeon]